MRWRVREEGNRVIIEFTCRDNYDAIELAEIVAKGMAEGELTLEFGYDETPTNTTTVEKG